MPGLETQRNRRILIIDDNPAIHDDFQKVLMPGGARQSLQDAAAAFFGEAIDTGPVMDVEIESAYQGQEGLEKVTEAIEAQQPFAMAFVDMRMPPGWDGLATIEQLWKVDPDLQIVICTAYSDHSWSDICECLGTTDQLLILKKPFDSVEVCQLTLALTEKWNLQRQARLKQDDLERMVEERTVELKEKDAALRQKQKMEAIGSLAGGVAHEFNNLLQAIQGYARFAQEGLDENNQRYQDIAQVLIAGNRAASLTSQLLTFSRTDEYQPEPTYASSALAALDGLLSPVIGEQITLKMQSSDDCPSFMADQGGLLQVLLNLCVNARDAMPDGGDLMIETAEVECSSRDCDRLGGGQPGDYVQFSVTDTGLGMTPEQAGRIFEPFFTTKEVGKGTGLGLAMVHGFVESHNGLIDVESEPGKGTVFRVLLPVSNEVVRNETAPELSAVTGGSETLLLAEDEPMVRAVATRILTEAGYHVLGAENGEQAIELFEEHQHEIDLMLLDVVMPKMTGRQAFDRIRQIDPDANAIFCTGYDPETSQAVSFHQDNLPLVQKPYDPKVLLGNIRKVLASTDADEMTVCKTSTPLGIGQN